MSVTEPSTPRRSGRVIQVLAGARRSLFGEALLAGAVLALVAVLVLHGITVGEFDHTSDEGAHAITGIFFRDFFRELPLNHVSQYAYQYYAQYPALGLIHWPPGFHVVEGVVFSMLGPSVPAARLTVALFALLGAFFWYLLVRRLHGAPMAAVSTVLMAALPGVLLCEKSVLLEVPSLSLCIAASYFWACYLQEGRRRRLYWFALTAAAALLTKQQSIYLAAFCGLTVVSLRKWDLLRPRRIAGAFALSALLVVPYYTLSFWLHHQTIAADVLQGTEKAGNRLTYYWMLLPQSTGWVVLGLALAGILTWRKWTTNDAFRLMAMWIAACYLTLCLLAQRQPRYSIYWLPPIAFFASGVFFIRTTSVRARAALAVLALAVLGSSVWSAWRYHRPYTGGYRAFAEQLVRYRPPGVVLFDGDAGHDFIFFMRALTPERNWIILRKNLYVARIMWAYKTQELAHTETDLRALFEDYGVRYVVVEDPIYYHTAIQKTLREFLLGPDFELVSRMALASDTPGEEHLGVSLYLNKSYVKPRKSTLRIPMLTLDHDIEVPLN